MKELSERDGVYEGEVRDAGHGTGGHRKATLYVHGRDPGLRENGFMRHDDEHIIAVLLDEMFVLMIREEEPTWAGRCDLPVPFPPVLHHGLAGFHLDRDAPKVAVDGGVASLYPEDVRLPEDPVPVGLGLTVHYILSITFGGRSLLGGGEQNTISQRRMSF